MPQQSFVLIHCYYTNGLKEHSHTNLSREDGRQWANSIELERRPLQQQFLVLIRSYHIWGLEMHLHDIDSNLSRYEGHNRQIRLSQTEIHFEQQFFVLSRMQNINRVQVLLQTKLSKI